MMKVRNLSRMNINGFPSAAEKARRSREEIKYLDLGSVVLFLFSQGSCFAFPLKYKLFEVFQEFLDYI